MTAVTATADTYQQGLDHHLRVIRREAAGWVRHASRVYDEDPTDVDALAELLLAGQRWHKVRCIPSPLSGDGAVADDPVC